MNMEELTPQTEEFMHQSIQRCIRETCSAPIPDGRFMNLKDLIGHIIGAAARNRLPSLFHYNMATRTWKTKLSEVDILAALYSAQITFLEETISYFQEQSVVHQRQYKKFLREKRKVCKDVPTDWAKDIKDV